MKRWIMIHKIKALYDEGNGLSKRAIARELGISRTTVRRYLCLSESKLQEMIGHPKRVRELGYYQDQLQSILQRYPRISAVKARRKLAELGVAIKVKERTFYSYVKEMKEGLVQKQKRYFEPIIDHIPGIQCQVDAGELRGVVIEGILRHVYFVVFVLSYSRMMYVGLSLRPLRTEQFIQIHDEAFRFFGGRVAECVYDQTKMVVIREEFREVWFNERFYQYATCSGFEIRVCEGYDPQSKGKVEAGVKYVKNNFFYGDEFSDEAHLQTALLSWIINIANERIHGTTREKPRVLFEGKEKSCLKPYLSPEPLINGAKRQRRGVDKTSLISFQSNKYSVPMLYQQSSVCIEEEAGKLIIYDYYTQEEIARHPLGAGKGGIYKNTAHYRDRQKQIEDYEKALSEKLPLDLAQPTMVLLKSTSPKIYKDQLFGLLRVLKDYQADELVAPFEELVQRSELKVSFIKNYLKARLSDRWDLTSMDLPSSAPQGKLNRYQVLTQIQENNHARS